MDCLLEMFACRVVARTFRAVHVSDSDRECAAIRNSRGALQLSEAADFLLDADVDTVWRLTPFTNRPSRLTSFSAQQYDVLF